VEELYVRFSGRIHLKQAVTISSIRIKFKQYQKLEFEGPKAIKPGAKI